MCQHYFTTFEQELLFLKHSEGMSNKKIAKLLDRNVSTIGRQLKKYTINGVYSPTLAAEQAQFSHMRCGRHKILEKNPSLLEKIKDLILTNKWSPEQISNRLKMEENPISISTNTIYRAIDCGLLDSNTSNPNSKGFKRNLRHKGKPRKTKNKIDNRGKIPISNEICDRPLEAENRTVIGHWEVDSVLGKHGKSCLVTLVDRKSRFLLCEKALKHTATEVTKTILRLVKTVSAEKIKSFTPDRGKEFAKHAEITNTLNGVQFYFPDPHSPWQRGTNENTNGLIREFIPKYIDIDNISDDTIEKIVNSINNRPRKCLCWKTPKEIFSR